MALRLKNRLQLLESLDFQYKSECDALDARLVEFEVRLKSIKLALSASVPMPAPESARDGGWAYRLAFTEREDVQALWVVAERGKGGAGDARWVQLVEAPIWARRMAPRLFAEIIDQMVEQAEPLVAGVTYALKQAEQVLDQFEREFD